MLIIVDFFFGGYELKSVRAGGGLSTWVFRLVAGQREVGGGTKKPGRYAFSFHNDLVGCDKYAMDKAVARMVI